VLVSIPRISSLLGGGKKEELTKTVRNIYATLLTVTMPAVFGVAVLSKEIILIISNEEFLAAAPAIIVSAVTMIICLGAYFWGQAILVPFKKENFNSKIRIYHFFLALIFLSECRIRHGTEQEKGTPHLPSYIKKNRSA
jgi:O-antigen/teichoic acid export membrane protein